MATTQAVRRWIITGAVTAITITGTMYGATLKDDVVVKKEKKRVLEATPEERLAQLHLTRDNLVAAKNEMELKISKHHERMKAKARTQVESPK